MTRITGYASVFDVVDESGDIVKAGAYKVIRPYVSMLYQHDGGQVIGVWETDQFKETEKGLWVEGVVTNPEMAELVKSEALRGLSIGYNPQLVRYGFPRQLLQVDLLEISLTPTPVNPHCLIETYE